MTAVSGTVSELAALLRPSLLRLTRIVRNQRVDTSVSLTHISALGTLEKHGPMSAGEAASCERVRPSSMTKVLASLRERGLVRREIHPTDRRQVILAISEAGEALLNSERHSRHAWLSQQLSRLSCDKRAVLRDVIPVLDKLAQR